MKLAKTINKPDTSSLLRQIDSAQRTVLELFSENNVVTAAQIGSLFGYQLRTASALCKKWVDSGFLTIHNPSNKARSYKLAARYKSLI